MNPIYTALVYTVWFFSTYFVLVFLLHLLKNRKVLFDSPLRARKLPKVSIILPAFNEEDGIEESIRSLNALDYPKDLLEIIIINDGSKDGTSKIVNRYADGKRIIFLDNKINKGKAACLNEGIALATGEFVACMDADSILSKNALQKTIPYFNDDRIGAVTVSVVVNNAKNILHKIIEIEYIIGLTLFLKAFSFFNSVFVTPGPFSIYRKDLLKRIGGFDTTNITEDLEIAYRIHKEGYVIENCTATSVRTNIPLTFKGLYTQRKRWYSGAILTAMQHKDMLMKRKTGIFGYFIPFNYALISMGIVLFTYSLFLMASNFIKSLQLYSLTGFNFWQQLTFAFDPLSVSIFTFFGITGFLTSLLIAIIAFRLMGLRVRDRLKGFLGFPFIFILYEIFWIASFYNVLAKKKIKWR